MCELIYIKFLHYSETHRNLHGGNGCVFFHPLRVISSYISNAPPNVHVHLRSQVGLGEPVSQSLIKLFLCPNFRDRHCNEITSLLIRCWAQCLSTSRDSGRRVLLLGKVIAKGL